MKRKIIAALAGAALVLGIGVSAAPAANAAYGTTVGNFGSGSVTVQREDGSKQTLFYGQRAYDVDSILIPSRTCVRIGTKSYYGNVFGFWVIMNSAGQFTVARC